eukprot:m.59208 g.59208  ORF g.59208 m.59208 type:complete len:306 (+) comp11228_c0_seq1:114-1031(+)
MSAKFAPGETVLCYHGSFIYKAKCLKTRVALNTFGDRIIQYRTHYNGWSTRWDEWVDDSRMIKNNDANRALQAQLISKHKEAERAKAKEKELKERARAQRIEEKKIKEGEQKVTQEITVKVDTAPPVPQQVALPPPDVKLTFPPTLDKQLGDDWNFVFSEKRLVPLPRTITVRHVLDKFKTEGIRRNTVAKANAQALAAGLVHIFDSSIGVALLYGFERLQYSEILEAHPEASMADIYGAEHLLRLLVVIPRHLMAVGLTEASAEVTTINQLLSFLDSNFEDFFVSEYEMATPDYMRAQQAFGLG